MTKPDPTNGIMQNRKARKWSRGELVGRVLWAMTMPFFRCSPRIFWGWRRAILRAFGARIGDNVHIYPSVRITIPWNISVGDNSSVGDRAILYALGPILIGSQATVSQGAHLCAGTHNWRRADMELLKQPICIGDFAWICADAFIGPGVNIAEGAIVGARGVAMSDIQPWVIVKGNPATVVSQRALPTI